MHLSQMADPPKKEAAAAAEAPKKEEAKEAPKKEEAKKGAPEPAKEEKKEEAKTEKMGIPHTPGPSQTTSKKEFAKKKEKEAMDGDSEHLYDGLHMPPDKVAPEGPTPCESLEGDGPPDPTKPPKKRIYNPEEQHRLDERKRKALLASEALEKQAEAEYQALKKQEDALKAAAAAAAKLKALKAAGAGAAANATAPAAAPAKQAAAVAKKLAKNKGGHKK